MNYSFIILRNLFLYRKFLESQTMLVNIMIQYYHLTTLVTYLIN